MIKQIWFWGCCILLWACHTENRNVKIIEAPRYGQKQLFGDSVGLAEVLGSPSRIYYFDSLLFLKETADDHKMVICDPMGKKIINRLIPKGRGPGEQLGTFFFTYSPQERKIFSFDITLRKVLEIDYDSILNINYKPAKFFGIPSSVGVLEGTMLNDSAFAVSGIFDDCRSVVFTRAGTIKKYGQSPDVKYNSPIDDIINQAYTGFMKASPRGDKYVIACKYADQLEIFNIRDSLQLFVKGPEMFEPKYSRQKLGKYTVLAHDKDEMMGYTDVCVTEDKIYALFAGVVHQPGATYCNTIRVFSWEGEYLMDYVLDHDLLSFCLDKENGYIYGIASMPGAEIYKFKFVL